MPLTNDASQEDWTPILVVVDTGRGAVVTASTGRQRAGAGKIGLGQ